LFRKERKIGYSGMLVIMGKWRETDRTLRDKRGIDGEG
jgi:hypothetical protein